MRLHSQLCRFTTTQNFHLNPSLPHFSAIYPRCESDPLPECTELTHWGSSGIDGREVKRRVITELIPAD